MPGMFQALEALPVLIGSVALVRYIHLNPVRARMVTDARDYPWSSHRAYLGAPCPDWLCIAPVLGRLGFSVDASRAACRRFMNEAPAVTEREALSLTARPGRMKEAGCDAPESTFRETLHTRSARSLEAIAAEVAHALGGEATVEELRSGRRCRDVVRARAEIARRALLEGAANLSQVARYLNRAPSTISDLLHGRR